MTFKWFIVLPPPILEFKSTSCTFRQNSSNSFLLVLLDCGTVYQQIMYFMTLLDNLRSVFKILSYALLVIALVLALFILCISSELLGPAVPLFSFMVSFNLKKKGHTNTYRPLSMGVAFVTAAILEDKLKW